MVKKGGLNDPRSAEYCVCEDYITAHAAILNTFGKVPLFKDFVSSSYMKKFSRITSSSLFASSSTKSENAIRLYLRSIGIFLLHNIYFSSHFKKLSTRADIGMVSNYVMNTMRKIVSESDFQISQR